MASGWRPGRVVAEYILIPDVVSCSILVLPKFDPIHIYGQLIIGNCTYSLSKATVHKDRINIAYSSVCWYICIYGFLILCKT